MAHIPHTHAQHILTEVGSIHQSQVIRFKHVVHVGACEENDRCCSCTSLKCFNLRKDKKGDKSIKNKTTYIIIDGPHRMVVVLCN